MHAVSVVCDFVFAHLSLFFVIIIIFLMNSNLAIIIIIIITIDILSYARTESA